jgi:hypothetical protein
MWYATILRLSSADPTQSIMCRRGPASTSGLPPEAKTVARDASIEIQRLAALNKINNAQNTNNVP